MMMREKEEETAKGDKSVLIVFKWGYRQENIS
jgi:hypothetical protein